MGDARNRANVNFWTEHNESEIWGNHRLRRGIVLRCKASAYQTAR